MRFVQPLNQRKHSLGGLPIEITRRFIRQQYLRLGHQCSGQRHPLLLPTAQLPRAMQRTIRQPDLAQPFLSLRNSGSPPHPTSQQRHGDILFRRKLRHEVVELPHITHLRIAKRRGLSARKHTELPISNPHLTRCRSVQGRQQMQQGALTRAALSYNRDHLACGHSEVKRSKELQLAMPQSLAGICLAQSFHSDRNVGSMRF